MIEIITEETHKAMKKVIIKEFELKNYITFLNLAQNYIKLNGGDMYEIKQNAERIYNGGAIR